MCLLTWPYAAAAQLLTADLEIKLIPSVGGSWQTISLENTYSDPVVVCTYALPSIASNAATVRVRSAGATSFDVKVQEFENSSAVTSAPVHCVISDEGAYDSGGLKYEARKVLSTNTSGSAGTTGWGVSQMEDVSGAVTQTYAAPAVLGQVMTENDVRASVFWTNDCDNRGNRPYQSGMADGVCVGKHIGQIASTRNSETLGYIVIETSTGTVNDIAFAAAVGTDTIAGTGNNPPYNYSVSGDFDTGILTQGGEDGGNGGWAVLYGADPLPNGQINLAVEEETAAGDTTRRHTTEQMAYWVFENTQSPSVTVSKSVEVFTGNTVLYSLPGQDMIYTLSGTNTGSGPVDNNSIIMIDAIPNNLTFYNGDIDDGGPETDAVIFVDNASGLSFNAATDVRYSNAATPPANFAACSYTPAAGYDAAVTHICINPKGALSEGTISASDFSVKFRARID